MGSDSHQFRVTAKRQQGRGVMRTWQKHSLYVMEVRLCRVNVEVCLLLPGASSTSQLHSAPVGATSGQEWQAVYAHRHLWPPRGLRSAEHGCGQSNCVVDRMADGGRREVALAQVHGATKA